jgi:hypothetical protein
MSSLKLIAEVNNVGIKAFDYPGDDNKGGDATERVLVFGTQKHPGTGNNLTYGIDLNTLTASDLEILMNPDYLEYAWESKDPIERRDRLIKIINANESTLDPRTDGAEREEGSVGYRLIFKRGPAEHHERREVDTATGPKMVDDSHFSGTSSWKSYLATNINNREMILVNVDQFRDVLKKLDEVDEDYTIADLSDDYMRDLSENGVARPIEPDDITIEEPEDDVDPEFVDDTPIGPDEIDDAEAQEIKPEVEIDAEFEDEPEDVIDVEEEPEIEVDSSLEEPELIKEPETEPKPEPVEIEEPKEPVKLTPDIEKAIGDRVRSEIEKQEIEPEKSDVDELLDNIDDNIPDELDEPDELEDEEVFESIGRSIDKALFEAGL